MLRLLTFLIISLQASACSQEEPLKIGFLGSLSGRAAEVSQSSRDGVILAIEEFNATGGLQGRKAELVIFDDRHDQETARNGVHFLADSGVVGIIGPITSQMAVTAVPEAEQRQVVLISPTTSTLELSEKKDHFFRTISTCDANARSLAIYARENLGAVRYAILEDTSNSAFTKPWRENFAEQVRSTDGTIVAEESFNSLEEGYSILDITKKLMAKEPEAVLVLANSIDAALFSQQLSKLGESPYLLGSDWSFTGDLLRYGGKSIDGFIFTTNLDMSSDDPSFIVFRKNYLERFDVPAKFPSVLAYEATQVLLKGISVTPESAHLKETLESIGSIRGLQGEIRLDSFGDVSRTTHINELRNGQLTCLRKMYN